MDKDGQMDPTIIYGIKENNDGEITDVVLTKPEDQWREEKLAYNGCAKNMGDGLEYAVFDKKGVRHSLKLDKDGQIVTDEDKKLKDVFTKELDEKEVAKLKEKEESTTKVSGKKSK